MHGIKEIYLSLLTLVVMFYDLVDDSLQFYALLVSVFIALKLSTFSNFIHCILLCSSIHLNVYFIKRNNYSLFTVMQLLSYKQAGMRIRVAAS